MTKKEYTTEELQELATLKQRAELMGIKYHPNTGLDKLRKIVNAKIEGKTIAKEETEAVTLTVPKNETVIQRKARLRKEASVLKRVRIVCLDPKKREWSGELFTVGNSLAGTFTRYVPYNTIWHIEDIMLKTLRNKKCQVFMTKVDSKGNKTRQGKLQSAYAIEELPPLTKSELKELAEQQARTGSIDLDEA